MPAPYSRELAPPVPYRLFLTPYFFTTSISNDLE